MKTAQQFLDEVISNLKRQRQEDWKFYHEAQLWKEQREQAEQQDKLIKVLEEIKL